ncbi:glycosyltransferase family 4 protein [Humisphaera borealis]|uniref:Glycosyltransferase family 4 protein n=1 Tax=Humisphaera borealis TaxID=2807512 RepID=A0A7M2WRI5_9BACT|nr:glycosyltransferase family 4 protein [Humisphaera borealis]QOV87762.1 glycosyltransferase family 4 protein [Humisphaera borealis]
MNIALVILHADPAKGGAETYTVDLAKALADRGHAISMLASTFSDAVDARIERVEIQQTGATRTARYVSFLDNLDRHLETRRYDIVHAMLPVRRCDLYHPHAGVAIEAVASGHLKHDSAMKQFAAKWANRLNRKRQRFATIEKTLLTPAAGHSVPVVLCLSDYIQSAVRRHYPLPADRFATLVNAVDLAKFNPAAEVERGRATRQSLGISPDKVVGLIVAQDFARKGLREAILAWKQAADPRLVLLVVGKDDFAPYAGLAAGAVRPENLVYAGATRDVRPFYATADFFVLPTRHDPCSLVVLEALAMGLPVISTRFNGACQVMTEGTHGRILNDPADVPTLAGAMSEMLDNAKRHAMRDACLNLRPSLSYETHLDRLCAIYESVPAD